MATSKYHHGNLRQTLLTEAARVLEHDGADAISLRGLARSLGVSHAAPAHHFASRNELLAELAADGYRELGEAMERSMEGKQPEEWLEATGHAYIRFALGHAELYRMMFASQLFAEDCPDRLGVESTNAYLVLLHAAYQREFDDRAEYIPQPLEIGAWSMVHGAVMLFLDGQLGDEVTKEQFLELADAIVTRHFAEPS